MAKQKVRVSFGKNEIGNFGKVFAGILLIIFTILPLIFMIGLWPDRMPRAEDKSQLYTGTLFHIQWNESGTLHINTIMFLLVALAGFTGSMIHIATSFTNYIGSEKFKRSWVLWYFVKPFTASGVALIFYLVLKAGLLNFDGANGANPFGIVILSALAGLFTDKATLKLEEIFTIIFKPKDDRPDKIDEASIKITGFEPKKILPGEDNTITVSGEGLDKQPLSIRINDQEISNADIKSNAISFTFKVPDTLKSENKLQLSILDKNGEPVYDGELELNGTPQAPEITVPAKEEEAVG
jgi:hypothetical protein